MRTDPVQGMSACVASLPHARLHPDRPACASAYLLMVFGLQIDGQMIDILAEQLARQLQAHLDGVIRIVIAECAATPDRVEADAITKMSLNERDLVLILEIIHGICTSCANHEHVFHVTLFNEFELVR